MANHENWRLVDCPQCDRKAGDTCFDDSDRYLAVHAERLRLAETVRRARVSLPTSPVDPTIKAHLTKYWSDNCKDGHPERCKGKRRIKNGRGFAVCENPTHVDLGNLAQQASKE